MIRWPTGLSKPEIVLRLFKIHAKLTKGDE